MIGTITIEQFFGTRANFGIHCDSREKATKLLEAFDKTGRRWPSGERYSKHTAWETWETHKEETCYGNNAYCGSVKFFKEDGYIVFEFEEIELEDI